MYSILRTVSSSGLHYALRLSKDHRLEELLSFGSVVSYIATAGNLRSRIKREDMS